MSELWKNSSVVTAFLAIQSEVDVVGLLKGSGASGKTVGVPRTSNGDMTFDAVDLNAPGSLVVGEFQIRVAARPSLIPPESVQLSLVPLIAFDASGNRLGAGLAFYDRWLAGAPNAYRLGVAFDAQELPRVPVEPHDMTLHAVVTESGIRTFG